MTHELPLGGISITTSNLLYQQCAEEFVKLLEKDANKLLERFQKGDCDELLKKKEEVISDLTEQISNLEESNTELQEIVDNLEEVDLGYDVLSFSLEKDNIVIRAELLDAINEINKIPNAQPFLL
jgi:hypothetical protein